METLPAAAAIDWQQFGPALHEELVHLPDKYRLPLLLCCLDNKTHEQAAEELRWPLGTVKTRLARGRELLHARLTNRGLTLSTALLAKVLSESAATAAVPAALVQSTIQAALVVAAGKAAAGGAVSAPVAALTRGVVHAMFLSRLKVVAVVLGVVLLCGAALAFQQLWSGRAGQGQPTTDAQGKPDVRKAPIRLDDMYVIVKAQLYEVDEAFYTRLKNARRVSLDDLEELERRFMHGNPRGDDPWDDALFKLLEKQKLILAGAEVNIADGGEAPFLSRLQSIKCHPSPDQVRKGDKTPQTVRQGVSFIATTRISWDRRYVHLRLTEKAVELQVVNTVKALDANGQEVAAEVPFVDETVHSRMDVVADGGSILIPVHYQPRSARAKRRRWVLCFSPRIYIEEEERAIKKGLFQPTPNENTDRQAGEPAWGKAVEGVQCRLRADKVVWKKGEIPTFKAEIRNDGKRELIVWRVQGASSQLQVDSRVFRWFGDLDAKSSPLGPGMHYEYIAVSLVKDWRDQKGSPELAPGKHTVLFVFLPEATDKGKAAVRAVSNTVEIEIVAIEPKK
jgi:hypothetical protein